MNNIQNARLVIAIVTSILQAAIIAAILIWVLPAYFNIHFPLYGTILILIGYAIYAFTVYRIGSTALRKKALAGLTDMVGVNGRAVSRLAPAGFVRIEGELWEARTESGFINVGTGVIVVKQNGLKLVVRPKTDTL
jgi:membrane-bound ClpP family serine protease